MARGISDRFGIVASAVCAVHCAAGAVLSGASGLLSAFFDETTELAFVVLAVGLAAFALARGLQVHGDRRPLALGVVGALILLAPRVGLPESLELASSLLGAAALITAHVMNLRALRAAECCEPAVAG